MRPGRRDGVRRDPLPLDLRLPLSVIAYGTAAVIVETLDGHRHLIAMLIATAAGVALEALIGPWVHRRNQRDASGDLDD